MRGPALTCRLLHAAVLQLAACRGAAAEHADGPVRLALDPRFVEHMSGVAWRSMTQESTEIGHALLLTLSHATHGLMNSRIETADLRPLPASELALLAPDRHRLTVRFSNRPAPVQVANASVTWTDVPPAPSPQFARR